MPSKITKLTPDFLEQEVVVRGVKYHLRELSIGDYDELVKRATNKRLSAMGEEEEYVDNALLLKLMVLRSSFDPKLTPETLAALPMRVVLKLNQTVNRMHYGDEPEIDGEDYDAEEDTDKGND